MIELKKFEINNFQFILLALLPVAFVIGPLIVELIVNTLIIIFIFNVFKNKKFDFIKNKIFIFLFSFYLILLLSHFNSSYFNETKLNVFFYFRFILFPFAVYEILKINKKYLKYLFIVLLFTILIVCFDGLIQFFFEKNLIGYEKYRVDRISGFFKDDLVLGGYLSRILPLLIGISLYFKNEKKLNKINILIIGMCILTIFLSGERAAFFKTMIGLILIFLIVNINWKIKILYFVLTGITIFFVIALNPIIFDRYVKQFKNHLFSNNPSTEKIVFMRYHYPMFQTSIKMFQDSKFLGKGPKTYRYHCDDPEFITFYPDNILLIDNTILKINLSWKQKGSIEIKEFFVKENDVINKNDKLFSYNFIGKDKETQKVSACNTHPHNFYFQLLAETGFLGFFYVFLLFLFISYLLIKNFILSIFNSSKKDSDSNLCILVGFFLVLWPLTTNGNFFNNWINLMNFYPLGIYLFLKSERINGKNNL